MRTRARAREDSTLGLVKLKTAEYRLMRRLREKAAWGVGGAAYRSLGGGSSHHLRPRMGVGMGWPHGAHTVPPRAAGRAARAHAYMRGRADSRRAHAGARPHARGARARACGARARRGWAHGRATRARRDGPAALDEKVLPLNSAVSGSIQTPWTPSSFEANVRLALVVYGGVTWCCTMPGCF